MVRKSAAAVEAPEAEAVPVKAELVVSAESKQPIEAQLTDAQHLDSLINEKIQKAGNALAEAYLDLAESLKKMKSSKGYKVLGYPTWNEYLASKKEFGRAYLFFLAKLGESDIGKLKSYLGAGIHASKFIEYAKAPVEPEKIPQLIDATIDKTKDLSVRETGKYLKDYLREHAELRKPITESTSGKKRGRAKSPWISKIEGQFGKLGAEDQAEYVKAMKEFLKGLK